MSRLPESGIDTDGELSSQDLRIVAIVPEKAQYDAKEPMVIIFKQSLPAKGPFMVDFVGKKALQVTARRLNNLTLQLETPPYYPAEEVTAYVYHGLNRILLGQHRFRFTTRYESMRSLIKGALDPVAFMCESLEISPSEIPILDSAMADSFQLNSPGGFYLLDSIKSPGSQGPSHSAMKHPTLLHFAVEHGLSVLVEKLMECPGALQACFLSNKDGQRPVNLAEASGNSELATLLHAFQAKDELYEDMRSEDSNPYYVDMQNPDAEADYIDMDGKRYHYMNFQEGADFYVYTSTHGYHGNSQGGTEGDEDDPYYCDMNEQPTDFIERDGRRYYYIPERNAPDDGSGYVCTNTGNAEAVSEEIYEEMDGASDQAAPECEYDVPGSNAPVDQIPRSVSVVLRQAGDHSPRTGNSNIQRRGSKGSERKSKQGEISRSGSTCSRISIGSNVSSASSSSYSSSREADSESTDFKEEEVEEDTLVSRKELLAQLQEKQKEKKINAYQTPEAAAPLPPPPDYERKEALPHPLPGTPPSRPHVRSKTFLGDMRNERGPAPPPPLFPRRQSEGGLHLESRDENRPPTVSRAPRESTTLERPPPPLPRETGKDPPAPKPRPRSRKK